MSVCLSVCLSVCTSNFHLNSSSSFGHWPTFANFEKSDQLLFLDRAEISYKILTGCLRNKTRPGASSPYRDELKLSFFISPRFHRDIKILDKCGSPYLLIPTEAEAIACSSCTRYRREISYLDENLAPNQLPGWARAVLKFSDVSCKRTQSHKWE